MAYQEAALKKMSSLCSGTAEQLDCAVGVLRELFPTLPPVDAYSSAEKLIPMINQLFRQLLQNEDSVMRQHMQAMVRARLYSSSVKNRLNDLSSDPALVSISTQDPLPLSLVFGERNALVKALTPNLFITGQDPVLPADIMDSGGRPFKALEGSVINRNQMLRKIEDLQYKIAPLIVRAPWAKVVDRGNIIPVTSPSGPNYRLGQTEMDTSTFVAKGEFTRWCQSQIITPAGWAALPAATSDFGKDVEGRAAYHRVIGDAATIVDLESVGVTCHVSEDGSEISGMYKTYSSTTQFLPFSLLTATEGNPNDVQAALPRNGSTVSGEIVVSGGAIFTYAEYPSGENGVATLVWRLTNIPSGLVAVAFQAPGLPVLGELRGALVTSTCPGIYGNTATLSDSERLQYIADIGMDDAIQDYWTIREELDSEGVSEEWWLQSYHKYIFGADPAYTAQTGLLTEQITRVKARMLCIHSWAAFKDLTGFLNKLYDDLGSLLALAQSTDFE